MALNARHKIFINSILTGKSETQSAIDAGYSKKTARSKGSQLLTNVNIKAAIDAAQHKAEEKAIVSREYVLEGLKELADYGREIDPSTGRKKDANVARAALDLLGKSMAMFTDKMDVATKFDWAAALAEARERKKKFEENGG